jgi:SAM-dependent methyltransferase
MLYDQTYYQTIWHRILSTYTLDSPIRDFGDITRASLLTRLLRQYVVPTLQPSAHWRVHDYGAGNWLYLGALFELCASLPISIHLKGVDYAQEALAFGMEKFRQRQPANVEVQIEAGDMLLLLTMQQEGSVDCILCLETLEHVLADQDAFRHFCRLLSPGGFLILSVPNRQPFWFSLNWFCYVFLRQRLTEKDRAVGHVRRYSVPTLLALAAGTDVAVLHIEPYGFFCSDYLKGLMAWTDQRIPELGKWLFPLCTRLLFLEHRWWNSLHVSRSEGFFVVFHKHE